MVDTSFRVTYWLLKGIHLVKPGSALAWLKPGTPSGEPSGFLPFG